MPVQKQETPKPDAGMKKSSLYNHKDPPQEQYQHPKNYTYGHYKNFASQNESRMNLVNRPIEMPQYYNFDDKKPENI